MISQLTHSPPLSVAGSRSPSGINRPKPASEKPRTACWLSGSQQARLNARHQREDLTASPNKWRPFRRNLQAATFIEVAHHQEAPNVRDCLLGHCSPGSLDFRLHGLEVEARALLHGWELDGRHSQFLYLLLNKHKAPEFVLEPLKVFLRPRSSLIKRPSRALERVQSQVGQEGHIYLGLGAEPATRLVDKTILIIIDAHCT